MFIEAFPSPPRLVVVGAVQVAMPLVRIARELGYETVVIDGRATFATRERFPDVDRLVVGWPDEVADEIGLGPSDAVAVLTHDVKFDEPAIVAALRARLSLRRRGRVSRKTQADRRRPAAGGRGRRRGARPAARPDRARPRRSRAGRDGAGDHGRDRRRALRRHGRADADTARGVTAGAETRAAPSIAAVVLAAGAATASAAPRALALLEGRPLGGARPGGGSGRGDQRGRGRPRATPSRRAASAIDPALDAARPQPRPRAGPGELGPGRPGGSELAPAPDGVVVLLGDQPLVRPAVIEALLVAAAAGARGRAGRGPGAMRTTAPRTRCSSCRRGGRLAAELAGRPGARTAPGGAPELVVRVPVDRCQPRHRHARGPRRPAATKGACP